MAKLSQFKSFSSDSQQTKQSDEEELKRRFDRYKNMSKEELNAQLFKEVARQKSAGNFDFEALSNMVESLKGNLSENDYNNVKSLLESLK